ncbi:hypothetical protein [Haloarcula onubensis]|uniref:Uncharacterized protein n=1 Tax=Haloarcula onubensis TaxID=2950539 RepID=A0ABU2FKB0_9EURY|nr:hypothetical protein [Halomicroarcula sp. S3CR25-11]MDS0280641.1 hypothetical protein [Halomicroarcula sp. S3CR25-11]
MGIGKKIVTWWPSAILLLLLTLTLFGPGSLESVVILILLALQGVMLLFRAAGWFKNVVESAAGMD